MINSSLTALLMLLLSYKVASQYSITLQNQTRLCEKYGSFSTSNGRYVVSTNEWGADESGGQCIMVGNNEDPTDNTTAWSSTWGWAENPGLVHAYPNVKFESAVLPLVLRNLSSMIIDVSWSYEGGSSATGKSGYSSLSDLGVKANVAIDMFFDPDSLISTSTTSPAYEVMVWLGSFGEVVPIGYTNGTKARRTVSSSEFNLYVGRNDNGQTVFSWLGPTNLTSFSGDIAPLVRHVAFYGGPTTRDYLGVFQFGSETSHTTNGANVTFTAKSVFMSVVKGIAPVDSAAATNVAEMTVIAILVYLTAFIVAS